MTTQTTNEAGRMFFAGSFRHAIDDKHRVAVPAGWRGGEGAEFFVVPSPSGACILVFPPNAFREVSENLAEEAEIQRRDQQAFKRQFNSRARLCALDKQGRLLVPAEMLAGAALDAQAFLAGNDNRFEIWNPERWDANAIAENPTYQHVAGIVGLL